MQPPAAPITSRGPDPAQAAPHSATPRPPLLLVGASVRAAAQSAWRAGYQPLAIDLFADQDLRRLTPARPLQSYPHGLPAAARHLPPSPWMYTGALENHPLVVDALSRERELWGVPAATFQELRDPWNLADAVRSIGWQVPVSRREPPRAVDWPTLPREAGESVESGPGEVRAASEPPRPAAAWLRKAFRSANGSHVAWADGSNHDDSNHAPEEVYYQQYVGGLNCSAAFVAAAGNAILLGVTRQLTGRAWLGSSGFQYCGSVGPLPNDGESKSWEPVRQLGRRLAQAYDLRGLFGVDLVLGHSARYCLEVNPRYTASVEVLERSRGLAAIALHARACQASELPPEASLEPGDCWAKGILYARRDVTVDGRLLAWIRRLNDGREWPRVADIPLAGQRIRGGRPVLTLLVPGSSPGRAEGNLRRLALATRRILRA